MENEYPISGFEPISAPCGQKVIKLTFFFGWGA